MKIFNLICGHTLHGRSTVTFLILIIHFGIESKDTKWEMGQYQLTLVTLLDHYETEYVILDLYV